MSNRRTRVSAAVTAVTAVLAGGLLSGCGVAGTDFQPGLAATVGSRTITNNEVDRLTTGVCGAFEKQLKDNNEVVPLRFFKAGILQSLALADAARQLGEQYDVTAGDQYRRQVAATESSAVGLSGDERDALVIAQNTQDLVQDIFGQVGAEIAARAARDNGLKVDDAAPSAATAEAQQIGSDAFAAWVKANDIEIDPQYGIELGVYPQEDGSLAYVKDVDSAVSFGVSDAAKAGVAAEPDSEATMKLPPSQRCGSFAAGGGGTGTIPGAG